MIAEPICEMAELLKLDQVKGRVQTILEAYQYKIQSLNQTIDELVFENKILKRKMFQQARNYESG